MGKKILLVVICMTSILLAYESMYGVVRGGTIHQFTPSPRSDADMIYFSNGITIDVTQGAPMLPDHLMVDETEYFLVHCSGAVTEEQLEAITSAGGAVYSYLPHYTFIVRMSEATRQQVTGFDFVDWTGSYHPAYKISSQDEFSVLTGIRKITILLYPDAALDAVAGFLVDHGAVITDIAETKWDKLINCEIDLVHLPGIAKLDAVNWIEPWHQMELHNDDVQWIVQTGTMNNRRIWDMGITGEGELLSTCDSGMRTSHYAFRNTTSGWITTWGDYPTHRKIIAYHPANTYGSGYADFGDESGNYYHGSHTGGTACGNDDIMGNPYAFDGVAIDSRIYFLDGGGAFGGIYLYPNLNDLFDLPYTGNAAGSVKLMSNSWGNSVNGAYTANAAQVDQFMWDHPDFLVFFSNGNDGPSGGSVGSPATAKNCVSVGGCQNASGYTQIYAFSSRGPTQDGRYKPTILTPGQNVISVYGGSDNNYWSMDGTSMAAPGAMGAGTLVREYFADGWYPSGTANSADTMSPSAALIKAVLVNCADPTITGYTNVPNNNIGWGRVDLDSALYFAGDARQLAIIDEETGLSTGQYVEYTYNVNSSSEPLRVTLVWTDYPAAINANPTLVNDLHLTVTDPSNNVYKGNVYSSGQSVTGGSYDLLNVEECVRRNSPQTGAWTVRVEGNNCPYGPQPFAIVVNGDITASMQQNVVYETHSIDDSGGNNNGKLDPGETVFITVTLRNDGSQDATSATGTLRTSSGDITIVDSVDSYGTIVAGGGTADGTFEVTASAATPQGTVVPLTVHLESNGGAYTTNCNFQIVVGLPRYDYVNHDIGNCVLTVTKHGSLGYLNQNSQGSGFIYPASGDNQLYHSTFALTNATNYVMDRFYPNSGSVPNNTDWLVTTTPDGRCWIDTIAPAYSDQESWALFTDSGYTSPKPLRVTQHGYAWSAPCYDDFVIVRNEVTNCSGSAVSDIYAGVIADFDMGDAYTNNAGTDAGRRLAYMWYPSAPNVYVGIKLLDPYSAANVSALENPVYVYNGATNVWHDTTLHKFLDGTLSFSSSPYSEDWSVVISGGPLALGAGGTEVVAFAFVGGSSLANLQENADSAQSIYDQIWAVEEYGSTIVRDRTFYAPHPNPFTQKTCLMFNLPSAQHVNVTVYNAAGQAVKTLVDRTCEAGMNTVFWDGRDERNMRLPNGVYFFAVNTAGEYITKKLIMVH